MPVLSSASALDGLADIREPDDLTQFGQWTARIWESPESGMIAPEDYPEITFGEEHGWDPEEGWLVNLTDRPNYGICMSGGGNRASTAGFGLMRALMTMEHTPAGAGDPIPFIDRFRYTSGVSGGNWFLKAWTFLPSGVPETGPDSFFGSHSAPKPRMVDDASTPQELHAAREVEVDRIREALFGLENVNNLQLLGAASGALAPLLDIKAGDRTAFQKSEIIRLEAEIAQIQRDMAPIAFRNLAKITANSRFLRGISNKAYWLWFAFDGVVSEFTDWWATYRDPQNPDDTQITRSDEAWTRQNVGPMLKEIELYGWRKGGSLTDSKGERLTDKLFTWNIASRQAIIDRNPQFDEDDFFMVERARPFSIMGVSAFENPRGTLSIIGSGLESVFIWLIEKELDAFENDTGLDILDIEDVQFDLDDAASVGAQINTKLLNRLWLNWPWLGKNPLPGAQIDPAVLQNAAQIEITPLYIGAAPMVNDIGGGFVESFAGDRDYLRNANSSAPGDQVVVRGNLPSHQNLTIADTMGMASAALGIADVSRGTKEFREIFPNADLRSTFDGWLAKGWNAVVSFLEWVAELPSGSEGLDFGTPELTHLPVGKPTASRTVNGIDGGYLENLGIFPLLRRRAERIVVCDMRGAPTHRRQKYKSRGPGAGLEWWEYVVTGSGATTQFYDTGKVDVVGGSDYNFNHDENDLKGSAVSHLFGERFESTDPAYLLGRYKNQVFDNSPVNGITPFEKLRSDMRKNYERHGVAFCTDTYRVIPNTNYGINLDEGEDGGDYEVEIFWYFLDSSPVWSTVNGELVEWLGEQSVDLPQRPIPKSTRDMMSALTNSIKKVPNIATTRTNLTDYEAAIMAMQAEWSFRKIQPQLQAFLFP